VKTIAIVSAKGGVGKTTVAANLGLALRLAGQPTLVVDLDPQNALRFHLGADRQTGISGLARASLNGTPWRDVSVQGDSGVHLLPFGQINEDDRIALEQQMNQDKHWLARHLESLALPQDTLVVLDTPPGPSAYLRQVLACAELAIIVTLPDAASYATLPLIESLITQYCEGRQGYLGHAYIVNQVDRTKPLARDAVQVIRNALGNRVIGSVHLDPTVGEALAYGKTVIEHAPHSQARNDLAACTQWVVQQLHAAGGSRA